MHIILHCISIELPIFILCLLLLLSSNTSKLFKHGIQFACILCLCYFHCSQFYIAFSDPKLHCCSFYLQHSRVNTTKMPLLRVVEVSLSSEMYIWHYAHCGLFIRVYSISINICHVASWCVKHQKLISEWIFNWIDRFNPMCKYFGCLCEACGVVRERVGCAGFVWFGSLYYSWLQLAKNNTHTHDIVCELIIFIVLPIYIF